MLKIPTRIIEVMVEVSIAIVLAIRDVIIERAREKNHDSQ